MVCQINNCEMDPNIKYFAYLKSIIHNEQKRNLHISDLKSYKEQQLSLITTPELVKIHNYIPSVINNNN